MGRKANPDRSGRVDRKNKSRQVAADESVVVIPACQNPRRRSRLEKDPLKWLAFYFGPDCGLKREAVFWYEFESQQVEMIRAIAHAIEFGGDQGIFASRAEGKTTYAVRTLLMFVLAGTIDFAVLLSATSPAAGRALKEISGALRDNVLLRADYPEVCLPVIALQGKPQRAPAMLATGRQHNDRRKKFSKVSIEFTWSGEQLVFPRVPGSPSSGSIFATRGLDSEVRGLKELGIRPKVIVIDDPDTPDTVGNPRVARKIEDNIDMSIAGLGGQQKPVARVMLCTLSHRGQGVAHTFADRTKKPSFVSRRFSFMVHKSDRVDLWMEYVDLRRKCHREGDRYAKAAMQFYRDRREIMDAGAVVANWHRYNTSLGPSGEPIELSPIQHYYNHWADKGRNGEMFCRCELDNEIIENDQLLHSKISAYRVLECVGTLDRRAVDSSTQIIVRGADIRKTEIHWVELAEEKVIQHAIINYDVRSHGTTETTVQQSEQLILEHLRRLREQWKSVLPLDENGMAHSFGVTLIDKGWVGSFANEDGELKTWANQPVETFCLESGLRNYIPAKGHSPYRSPPPANGTIIGDRWHINGGEGEGRRTGEGRRCTEIIWDADHWHLLVEELFTLPDTDPDRFVLFVPRDGIYVNHKAFGEHIAIGAEEFKAAKNAGSRSRKPRFVRDHWYDATALALVAQSVEHWMRENLKPASSRTSMPRSAATRQTRSLGSRGEEIGAR